MWLIELYLAISVLCLITSIGIQCVMKEQIKANGYISNGKKSIFRYLVFFIPIMNIIATFTTLIMISTHKSELEDMIENYNNKKKG